MAEKAIKLNSGYMMPTVALGCWQADPGVVGEAVKQAIRAGYRHIDTAENYLNEAEIGTAIKEMIDAGEIKREELFIVTKLGSAMMHPTHVREEFDRSLKALKTDYIDLFLLHAPFALSDEGLKDEPRTAASVFPMYSNGEFKLAFIDPVDSYKEMEKLVKEGLVRSIGVSNFGIKQLQRLIDNVEITPANLQNECHAWYQTEDIVQFCKKKGISFSAYSPIGNPGRPAFISGTNENLLDDPLVVELAKKYKRTSAQILLRFLVQRGLIVLPKSTNPGRIKQNIEIYDFSLSEEDMSSMNGIDRNRRVISLKALGAVIAYHPFL